MCVYIYIYSQWINEKKNKELFPPILLSSFLHGYQSLGFEFAREKKNRQILLKEFRRNLGFRRCAFETQCLGERDTTTAP